MHGPSSMSGRDQLRAPISTRDAPGEPSQSGLVVLHICAVRCRRHATGSDRSGHRGARGFPGRRGHAGPVPPRRTRPPRGARERALGGPREPASAFSLLGHGRERRRLSAPALGLRPRVVAGVGGAGGLRATPASGIGLDGSHDADSRVGADPEAVMEKSGKYTVRGDFLRNLPDDELYLPSIKEHSLEKIRRHNYYARMFATSMKNKWPQRAYVGLYSGAGRARIEGTGEIIETTALSALRLADPFTK